MRRYRRVSESWFSGELYAVVVLAVLVDQNCTITIRPLCLVDDSGRFSLREDDARYQ